VSPKLWRVSDGRSQLLVNVLLVEAELVEHANQEAVFLLGVVLTLVGAVVNAKLENGKGVDVFTLCNLAPYGSIDITTFECA